MAQQWTVDDDILQCLLSPARAPPGGSVGSPRKHAAAAAAAAAPAAPAAHGFVDLDHTELDPHTAFGVPARAVPPRARFPYDPAHALCENPAAFLRALPTDAELDDLAALIFASPGV